MKSKLILSIVLLWLLGCGQEEIRNDVTARQDLNATNVEVAFPHVKGTPVSLGGSADHEVVVTRKEGQHVWMGDIILTDEQVDGLIQNLKHGKNERTALRTLTTLWPGGVKVRNAVRSFLPCFRF